METENKIEQELENNLATNEGEETVVEETTEKPTEETTEIVEEKKQELKQKDEEEKKKNKLLILIIIILLILLLIGSIFVGFMVLNNNSDNNPNEPGKGNMGQLIEEVGQIVEMPDEDKQAAVDKLVAENEINISYNSTPVFYGTKSTNFKVVNIPNNRFPIIFIIYDENGEIFYESDLIDPGYEVRGLELDKELEPGEYNYSITIGYYNEGNVQSKFPLNITVREKE